MSLRAKKDKNQDFDLNMEQKNKPLKTKTGLFVIVREGSFLHFLVFFEFFYKLVFSSRKDTNLESTPGMETNYYLTEPVSSLFNPFLAVSGSF